MVKILAAGDFHGDKSISEKLAQKAKKNKVDLVILAGDIHGAMKGDDNILEPFKKNKQKTLFIPGNWDTKDEMFLLEKHSKNIHHYYVTYEDVSILGIGSPDWQMELDDEDTKQTYLNFKKSKAPKKILVSHLHAEGTLAEFSGIPGEETLRNLIDHFQPNIFIAAHIHEAEGIEEKIGKTQVFQVGKQGRIFEI